LTTALELYGKLLESLRSDGGDRAIADALDLLARGTGENKFRHASNILRGTVAGRRPINDADEIAEIADLEAKGHRRSRAVSIVARRHATAQATADSLARRYRGRLAKISG
jgi:hypothetical protein